MTAADIKYPTSILCCIDMPFSLLMVIAPRHKRNGKVAFSFCWRVTCYSMQSYEKVMRFQVQLSVVLLHVSVRVLFFLYFRRRGTKIPAAVFRECGIIPEPVTVAYLRYGQVEVKQRVQNPLFLTFTQPLGYCRSECFEAFTECGI